MAHYIKNEKIKLLEVRSIPFKSFKKKAVKLKEAVAKKHHPKIFTFYTPSLDHT